MFFLFWLSKTLVINFLFKFFLQPSHHHHPLHERIVPFSHLISSQIIHSPIPFPSFPRPYFLITTNLHRHHCLPSHRHHPPPSAHHPPYTSFDPLIFIIIITITLVYQILFSILSKHKKKKKKLRSTRLSFFLFVCDWLPFLCLLCPSTLHGSHPLIHPQQSFTSSHSVRVHPSSLPSSAIHNTFFSIVKYFFVPSLHSFYHLNPLPRLGSDSLSSLLLVFHPCPFSSYDPIQYYTHLIQFVCKISLSAT